MRLARSSPICQQLDHWHELLRCARGPFATTARQSRPSQRDTAYRLSRLNFAVSDFALYRIQRVRSETCLRSSRFNCRDTHCKQRLSPYLIHIEAAAIGAVPLAIKLLFIVPLTIRWRASNKLVGGVAWVCNRWAKDLPPVGEQLRETEGQH